ncbi:MAG: hypothetical protein LAT67_06525 [Balneolales bacterium]|nr:hypothetical protein [Balneolales bacterium]
MNTSRFLYSLVLLLASFAILITEQLYAQHFEGEIHVEMRNSSGEIDDSYVLFIKENRLRIDGDLKRATNVPVLRDGLTIRSDLGDLLIHTGNRVAVVNLNEAEMLFRQLMPRNENRQIEEASERIRMQTTDERRTIDGRSAYKTILTDTENPGNEAHLWLVSDLQIAWGELFQPIEKLAGSLGMDGAFNLISWPDGYTPVLVENFNDGELNSSVALTRITQRRLQRAESDIAQGQEVISLFQLMMQQN